MPGPSRPRVRFPAALAALPALLVLPLTASPAAAEPAPPGAPSAYETRVSPAEYYADLMADEPEGAAVVVDAAVAGLHDPEELEADLREAFDALGEPYHVVVSPFPGPGTEWGGAMLPALHDRLGSDGVYVHLRPDSSLFDVAAYGVALPVDEARSALLSDPDLDYGAPVDQIAEGFVRALTDPGGAGAADPDRYGPPSVGDRFAEGWRDFLDDLDPTSHNGPGNTGFLAGTLGGFVLGAGGYLVWRRLRRGPLGGSGVAVATGTAVATVVLAGAVSLAPLAHVVGAPEGGAEVLSPREEAFASPPYVVSTARVEQIAREMEENTAPLYVDPRTPSPLDGLAATAERLADTPVPVRALVLPMDPADEFSGDPEVLAHALASVSGEDAVYLVAGHQYSEEGVRVSASAVGLGTVDSYELWTATGEIEEPSPAQALDAALDALEGVEVAEGAYVGTPYFMDSGNEPPGPRVPRYFSGGFPAGVLLLGPLAFLALAGTAALVRLLVRRPRRDRATGPRALRRMALRESGALRKVLASDRAGEIPRELMPPAEAVLIAMEHDPDDLDHVGAVVVSRRVMAALADPGRNVGRAPCRVNPLHGPSTSSQRLRAVRGSVPMCASCAGADEAVRAARVLHVRDRQGGRLAYLSLDDRAWVRHHFGAERPARMAERLLEEIDAR
ncbi:hypothetical protein Q8A49_31500 [Nocardiopsis umidischolae]|uniref:DUF4350 domain-containing protein n=2 Tax=Nocardiopsis tropica TaxID=109330 RepID=A0ABU7L0E7_9ACTN|nr:hypothetical protein [Nocardiopsis umidischolae]